MSDYGRRRRNLKYYKIAKQYIESYKPKSLLDVGSGIQYGCKFLETVNVPKITSLEHDQDKGVRLANVQNYFFGNILGFRDETRYNVVCCLQVIEHVQYPEMVVHELFCRANKGVVISVPYKWPQGFCKSHVQDPVDEAKLLRWVGRKPTQFKIVGEHKRLVAKYNV